MHDYLTQRGGAERVVLAMTRAFPEAVVHTSLYDPDGTYPEFRDVDVRVSGLNRVPLLRSKHQIALPVLPWAMRRVEVGDVDVVLVSSSGWAHGVHSEVPVVVYCHNTPRWLYQVEDYELGLGWLKRLGLRLLDHRLRRWDGWAAQRAHRYLANSRSVQARISDIYGREAELLPPPLCLDPNGPQSHIPGIEPGYLLTVSRVRGYKATQLIADAAGLLPHERLVIVGGTPPGFRDHPNVTVVEDITDEELRWLYANAEALVAMSREDFGLTPPEANSHGVPSLVLRAGGYLETTVEGVSGLFIDESDARSLADGIERLRDTFFDPEQIRRHAAQFDEETFAARLRDVLHDAAATKAVAAQA